MSFSFHEECSQMDPGSNNIFSSVARVLQSVLSQSLNQFKVVIGLRKSKRSISLNTRKLRCPECIAGSHAYHYHPVFCIDLLTLVFHVYILMFAQQKQLSWLHELTPSMRCSYAQARQVHQGIMAIISIQGIKGNKGMHCKVYLPPNTLEESLA